MDELTLLILFETGILSTLIMALNNEKYTQSNILSFFFFFLFLTTAYFLLWTSGTITRDGNLSQSVRNYRSGLRSKFFDF
jgi:hypothetical protein